MQQFYLGKSSTSIHPLASYDINLSLLRSIGEKTHQLQLSSAITSDQKDLMKRFEVSSNLLKEIEELTIRFVTAREYR